MATATVRGRAPRMRRATCPMGHAAATAASKAAHLVRTCPRPSQIGLRTKHSYVTAAHECEPRSEILNFDQNILQNKVLSIKV